MLTTEKIYKMIYTALKEKEEIQNLDQEIREWQAIENLKTELCSPDYQLINLLKLLQRDIAEQENKKNGKGNLVKAMNNVVKNAKKRGQNINLYGFTKEGDYTIVCDGYRIIRTKEEIQYTEQVEGIPAANKTTEEARQNAVNELIMPTIGDLKAYIKLMKAEDKKTKCVGIPYTFEGEGEQPTVNADYLLDILTAFPDARGRFTNLISPIYFEGAQGDGIILPIRL